MRLVQQKKVIWLVLALLLAAPLGALASGGEHHQVSPWDLRFHLLNFLLYVGLMYALLKKPFSAAMTKRREVMEDRVAKAGQELSAAESALAVVRQKLQSVDSEAAKLSGEIRSDAEREAQRIVADAEKKAQRVKAQGVRLAQAEVKSMEAALRRELGQLVLRRAEERVRSELTAEKDQVLRQRASQASKELFQ